MDLESRVASIRSKSDLADFVDALSDDLQVNGEEWGHITLDGFLGVLAGSIRVLDRIYRNEGKEFSEDDQWAVFAEMLLAARIRE
jgi:hypothetical protein